MINSPQAVGLAPKSDMTPMIDVAFSLDELRQELREVVRDASAWVPDPRKLERRLISCVIEPHPGTLYEDVARTADIVRGCGFTDVDFGGGLGAWQR